MKYSISVTKKGAVKTVNEDKKDIKIKKKRKPFKSLSYKKRKASNKNIKARDFQKELFG